MSAILGWLALAWAGEVKVDSAIVAVVVYGDRARVTREATVDIPVGRSDVMFEGLPIGLLAQSLSAEGEGNAGATLTGLDIRPLRGTEDRDVEVAKLRKDRLAAHDRIAAQSDAVARAQADIAYLRALQPKAPSRLQEATFLADDAPAQLAQLSRDIGEDMREAFARQRTAERIIREQQRELDRIDRDLQMLATPQNEDSQRVAVGLDAPRAGKVTVRLDYVVSGATWTAHYDARFVLATGKVTLDLSGDVVQTTGEDWKNVRLTLSTARPNEGTAPPVLQPFYLQEGYSGGYNAGPASGMASGEGAFDMGGQGNVAIADRVAAIELEVKTRETVASGGTRRRVYLTTHELTGDIVHHVVARRLEAAWLATRLKNSAEYPLMPGGVSSYLGSAYVGEGHLPLTAPGETFDLSFGADDRVGVKRTRLQDVEGAGKGLSNKDHRAWGFATTVKNRSGKPISVRVHEQVPVSSEATWEVQTTTVPALTIPSNGVFYWDVTIPDQSEQKFELRYTITWPKGDMPNLLDG